MEVVLEWNECKNATILDTPGIFYFTGCSAWQEAEQHWRELEAESYSGLYMLFAMLKCHNFNWILYSMWLCLLLKKNQKKLITQ